MRYLIDGLLVLPGTRRLLRQAEEVRIGGRAFDLLLALIERRDRVVSKEELYALVWPQLRIEPNNLAFQVWALRQLLGPQAVVTVARRGYQLATPVRELPDDAAAAAQPPASAQPANPPPGGLAAQLLAHRLVTLVDTHAQTRHQQAQHAARQLAPLLAGGSWWLPRCPPAEERERLLRRLGPQAALLVLEDGHLQPRATLDHINAALGASGALRLLVTALHPLGHPLEQLAAAEPQQTATAANTGNPAPHPLRWKQRGTTGHPSESSPGPG